jgi:hypothetical protein
MKYLVVILCGTLALLSGLSTMHPFRFIQIFTNWPLAIAMIAAATLVFVRRGRLVVACSMGLLSAGLLLGVGAFFTFICLLFHAMGPTAETAALVVDLILLVGMAGLSMVTGALGLGWGFSRGMREHRRLVGNW